MKLLHQAISDESFRIPVYDILHYHSLHSHILALLQFTLPYKVWLELLRLVHQTLKMMIFNIMQQISYYPGSSAIWQMLALAGPRALCPFQCQHLPYGTRAWVITKT